MKLISWNVNGLRACCNKGFMEYFAQENADIFCVQETKMQPEQWEHHFDGYEQYFYSAEKKGYSGTAVFTKIKPLHVSYGLNIEEHDHEGRVITLEFDQFYLVNVYVPNSKDGLLRLDYRMIWEDAFKAYCVALNEKKPVLICGDMNVAHQEIDIKNPNANRNNPGFTDQEREKMTALINAGFTDSFRYLYPDKKEMYSWWSYRFKARERNAGWRIDYWLISNKLQDKIKQSEIATSVLGSDHCPVLLEIDL